MLNDLNHFERECRKCNDELQEMDELIFDFDQGLDACESKLADLQQTISQFDREDLFDPRETSSKFSGLRKRQVALQKQKEQLQDLMDGAIVQKISDKPLEDIDLQKDLVEAIDTLEDISDKVGRMKMVEGKELDAEIEAGYKALVDSEEEMKQRVAD